ncbi:sigma-54-dependent transcriptional regulator [Bradyrhizobium sp. HKCCYLS2038]|uniref:sigma-54-dependent transcriptional regulator n=1 Tax=unclassified Bradyrhizobium TaxID=2631580 RepID=UPI003EB7CD70
MTRVLIVDDQSGARRSLALLLENAGIGSVQAGDGVEALRALEVGSFDVVISDLRMDNMCGIELLKAIRRKEPDLPLILVTAYGTVESAVEAMRLGAYDYVTKPFREKDILEKIHNAQQSRHLQMAAGVQGEAKTEDVRPDRSDGSDRLIVTGAEMQAIATRIERVARTDLSVLITGETGTGKSRCARNICELSHRASKRFVSINCASLPEQLLESELFGHVKGSFTGATQKRIGLFEEADGGTIFFDEVDTLSQGTQAKLLSVLQDREIRPVGSNRARRVDVRVISAANRNLETLIARGEFRADLYYRLNGIRIHLPSLRERGDDLRILVERLLERYVKRYGRKPLTMTPAALNLVLSYSYPGNIRQLESFIEQMVVFSAAEGVIDSDALPEELSLVETSAAADVDLSLGKSERIMIEAALSGSQTLSDVARRLGIGRTTLWRKIRQHNIQRSSVPKSTNGSTEIKSSN